jgi:acyl carrier protein
MTEAEARMLIFEVLGGIAPEADPATITGDANLRETLDLDSMDFINFVVALHERTGLDIPEADYPELHTLNRAIAYLRSSAPA